MCTQRYPYNWSRELYQRHGETIKRYLTDTVIPILRDKIGQGGPVLLQELQQRWINHQIMNQWLEKFFMFLDRYYVKQHSLPTLAQAGLRCFHTHVYDDIKKETTAAVLGLVMDDRDGKTVDKTLVKNIVRLYEAMGTGTLDGYINDLEDPLLKSSREYNQKKREDWTHLSTPYFLIKVEGALKEEIERVNAYLNPITKSKLL